MKGEGKGKGHSFIILLRTIIIHSCCVFLTFNIQHHKAFCSQSVSMMSCHYDGRNRDDGYFIFNFLKIIEFHHLLLFFSNFDLCRKILFVILYSSLSATRFFVLFFCVIRFELSRNRLYEVFFFFKGKGKFSRKAAHSS